MTKASLFLLITLALLLGGCATNQITQLQVVQEKQIPIIEIVEVPYQTEVILLEPIKDVDQAILHSRNFNNESCDVAIQNKLKKAIANYILTHYPTRCPFKTEEIAHHVVELCDEQGVDINIIIAIMQAESQFVPEATNKRSKAAGLMQVMPFWAKDFNIKSKQELYEIETNIYAGIRVLKIFLDEHNGNMTKALYRYVGGSKKYPNQVLVISKKVSTFIASNN